MMQSHICINMLHSIYVIKLYLVLHICLPLERRCPQENSQDHLNIFMSYIRLRNVQKRKQFFMPCISDFLNNFSVFLEPLTTNAWAFFWKPVTSWKEWKSEKTDKMFCTLLVVMKCISGPYHFVPLQARTVMYHCAHTHTQIIKINYMFNSQLHLHAEALLLQISEGMFYRFTSTQDCITNANRTSPGKRLDWNSFRIFLFKAFSLTQSNCTSHYSFYFSILECINY